MIVGLLREFPGYTLSSLMDEDTELVQLLATVRAGEPDDA